MDALRKLEDAQRSLLWMQQEGLASNHRDSDRFLSDFLLFLAKPCTSLTMEDKCLLISQHLPKIKSKVVEGTGLFHNFEDYDASHSNDGCIRNEISIGSIRTNIDGVAMIGLDAMQRANSTLEDFCRSYFMFHEMDVNNSQSFFKFLPVLSFTESYIYQLDNLNENSLTLSTERTSHDGTSKLILLSDIFKTDPFRPLIRVLECRELLNQRIRAELRCGEEYWALERKLCIALGSNSQILIEDVLRAVHLKSFDYRVLNLLVYQLMREEVNEVHMEFLSVSEFLVEVSDDLFDYEDDVLNNSFNILRMFVRIYGASMAPIILGVHLQILFYWRKKFSEFEYNFRMLKNLLNPSLVLSLSKRSSRAAKSKFRTLGRSTMQERMKRINRGGDEEDGGIHGRTQISCRGTTIHHGIAVSSLVPEVGGAVSPTIGRWRRISPVRRN
ncbi:hypothetical protein Scep_002188 [Stephania cephalantha]|uniref:Uncharacterized protein n=1 Tax=Stephania cephalantha TaxID=152367 RepID=A0AAP0LAY8_9MAGN